MLSLVPSLLMILNSGNEIGPFRAVEESTLAHLAPHETLSDIFAWYSLVGSAGTALGMVVCGWTINFLQVSKGLQYIPACHIIFFGYAAVGLVKFLLTLGLSQDVEAVQEEQKKKHASRTAETRPLLDDGTNDQEPPKRSLFSSVDKEFLFLVIQLLVLFGLDSFASGLASL